MASADWSRLAKIDLERIYQHIAGEDGRQQNARRAYATIRGHCNQYAIHAADGHVLGLDRSDLAPGLRTFAHKRWLVLFRITKNGIHVLAVVDGRRDYSTLFLERAAEKE